MDKKKVALIDTNFSSLPIYEYLLQLKYKIFVLGNNPNDYLAKFSNNYVNIDYSDTNLLYKFLIKNKVNFIVPGCNDVSYSSCSLVNSEGQFSGIEKKIITDAINRKNKFKDFCHQNNIPTPRKIISSQLKKNLPVLLKPINSFSGKGIHKLSTKNYKDRKKLESDAKKYSSMGRVIIEEFLSGQLYSHSAFISQKEIIHDFFVEEHCIANPYAVDTSSLAFNISEKLKMNIRKEIDKIVKNLDLLDGLIHTQFIARNDEYWLIESTRRCPGDLYSLLIEKTTGFPYSAFYTKTFINSQKKEFTKNVNNKFILRHTISSPKKIPLKYLRFKKPISMEEIYFFKTCGSLVQRSPYGRIGVVFFALNSIKDLKKYVKKIKRRELYDFY